MREKRYCAFCRTPRNLNLRKHVGTWTLAGLGVFGIALMWAVWQEFDPRVIPLIAFFWGLAEVLVQFRWRLSMVCPECGFDPVVYARSHAQAADKVKAHLERRRQDPGSLLRAPLSLPRASAPAEGPALQSARSKPQIFSKQV